MADADDKRMMIPIRRIYARIHISEEELTAAITKDKKLDERMTDLSYKHKAKAWRRIQGRRFSQSICDELRALAKDLRYACS